MTNAIHIDIVEYEPRYAASIADMWNASQESWGGDGALQTEQMILEEHHNSPHLNIFLALAGDKVIGYCSFSHYKEDIGALYIALLNVSPEYHGQKVGKRLVLRAVEETIKLGWPRVDLYTWPGNVKAVPTYKKAGFFWERREDVTHLINLIPSVLQTPAVQPFFEKIDWYNDSIREIATEPDGTGENGFDYFTYEWRKDDLYLRMEYERTGRGLRLIETDDYLISATIPARHRLPFGASYPIEYKLTNKTGKPLHVDIQSKSNKQVTWSLNESFQIEQEETITSTFELSAIEEEQDPFQTHPVVEAELLINGQSAVFKLGVEPRFPVRLKLQQPQQTWYVGKELELEVSLENEYDTEQTYRIHWPEHPLLTFREPELHISVPAHGRQAVTVQATLLDYGIWHQSLLIEHKIDSPGESDTATYIKVLEQPISLVLPGAEAVFGGETAEGWVASNGLYHVHLNKLTNTMDIYKGSESGGSLYYPKFGLPYSNEFKQDRATSVSFRQEDSFIMEAEYELESLHVRLRSILAIGQNGIITHHYEVQHTAEQDRTEPLFLKEKFTMSWQNSMVPYRGSYVDTAYGPDASSFDYWLMEDITENWVFTRKKNTSWGITWPQDRTLMRDHWQYAIEHPLGALQAGETVCTPPMRIAGGTWSDWKDFRAFALQESSSETIQTKKPLEIIVNGGNPFISEATTDITIIEHKNTVLSGQVIASSQQLVDRQTLDIPQEQQVTRWNESLTLSSAAPDTVDLLGIKLDMDSYELEQQRLLIPISDQPIISQVVTNEHGDVHAVNNGVLEFKVSNDFAPAVFSLQHNGVEWLDSAYPEPGPKSWWNPWTGGMTVQIKGMSPSSMMKQPRSVSFTEITDSLGNHWHGIAVDMDITDHPIYKGLSLRQYYVTLPGTPVMASFVRIRQHTGSNFAPLLIRYWNFYKGSEQMTDSRVTVRNLAHESLVYKAGKAGYETETPDGVISLSSPERTHRLSIVSDELKTGSGILVDAYVILSEMSQKLYTRHGEEDFIIPQFYVFAEQELPVAVFKELKQIRFHEADTK